MVQKELLGEVEILEFIELPDEIDSLKELRRVAGNRIFRNRTKILKLASQIDLNPQETREEWYERMVEYTDKFSMVILKNKYGRAMVFMDDDSIQNLKKVR